MNIAFCRTALATRGLLITAVCLTVKTSPYLATDRLQVGLVVDDWMPKKGFINKTKLSTMYSRVSQ